MLVHIAQNVKGTTPKILKFLYYMHLHFKIFGKYCLDDCLMRPKLVANIRIITQYYIIVSDGVHI